MPRLNLPIITGAALAAAALVSPAYAERIPLAAHRAIYELALDPAKTGTKSIPPAAGSPSKCRATLATAIQ